MSRRRWATITLGATCVAATPAAAQDSRTATVTAASEIERRGLSWSEGRAGLAADLRASTGRWDAAARVATTRGSARHAGADAVVDLIAGIAWDLGAVRVRGEAIAHLFAGARGRMDYVEGGVSAGYTYGPIQATLGVLAAPSQDAIGGSNVHLYATANAGIPGTPFTVVADVAHSSGRVRDAVRADRLRPGGSYANWRLGVDYYRDRWTLGVDYVGTDIARGDGFGPFADARHAGDRLVARAQLTF